MAGQREPVVTDERPSRAPSMLARLALGLASTLIGLALVEGLCRLAVEDGDRIPRTLWGSPLLPKDPADLRAAGRSEASYRYLRVDPALGWTIAPGRSTENGVLYAADEKGMRTLPGPRSSASLRSSPRIAAYGDSFTHCDEVPFEECWTDRVEREAGVQVVNAGVPGYGTDQAYLRYLETREALRPDVVILGLMIGDVKRNVNVFRTFLSGWTAWSKPRFVLDGDGIALINHPAATPAEVPDLIARRDPLLERDWWYDPAEWEGGPLSVSVAYRFARARLFRPRERPSLFLPNSEPTLVTARIVESFARDVEAAGGRFLCLVIPSRPDLRHGDPVPWQPLLTRLRLAGVEIVDPTNDLRELAGSPGLFRPLGHYALPGNEVLARFVLRALRDAPPREDPGNESEKDTVGTFDPKRRIFSLLDRNAAGVANRVARFGGEGSLPLIGDFDGDGVDTVAVYVPALGEFSQRDSNDEGPAVRRFRYGGTRQLLVPIVGDWDGRGGDSVGVYSPELGRFLLRNSNDAGPPDVQTPFGPLGAKPPWIPIAGNWSGGDAPDGIGLYDPTTGRFALKHDPTLGGPADLQFNFGAVGRGLVPIVGDWNGDGIDTIGLYDPAERTFFLRNELADGPADRVFRFGARDQLPVAGNFDGR